MFINIKILATELDDYDIEVLDDEAEIECGWREVTLNLDAIDEIDEEDKRALLLLRSGQERMLDMTREEFLTLLLALDEEKGNVNIGTN